MSYSDEYLTEWHRREELLRALTSAAVALEEAINYERHIGNSATANIRMQAVLDHLETVQSLTPRQVSRKFQEFGRVS